MTAGARPPARPRHRALLVAVLVAGLLSLWPVSSLGQDSSAGPDAALPAPVLTEAPGPSWPTPEAIDGEAHLLVEATTGQWLVADNAHRRRPVASTIKALTAYTTVRRSALDEMVTIGDEVLGVEGAGVGLEPGDQWSVEDLLEGLVARSGNDAAEALAVHVGGSRQRFLELMEQDAAVLGIEGLALTSPSGLDDTQLVSAADLATIALAVLEDPDLRTLVGRRVVALPDRDPTGSRNELLGDYEGATGIKTGFTSLAGNSLIASARRDGRELVAVVLGAGDDPARFTSATNLLDHGFEETRPTEVGAELVLRVGGGTVRLAVPPGRVTVPADSEASLELTVPVRAPEEALQVPVLVDGQPLGTRTATPEGGPGPPDDPTAGVGRALVDGTYAALRAATAAGTL